MPHYLFIYDERDNSFPERYRVIGPDDDAILLRDKENLTGTVLNNEAIGFLEDLLERCRVNDSLRAELVDVPDWRFVELRFRPAEAEAAENASAAQRNYQKTPV
jgi:hypothetical protein